MAGKINELDILKELRFKDKDGFLVLSRTFTQNGFSFRQIWREGDYAIYEKAKPNWKTKHFEAIKIKKHNGFVIAGNTIEPSENYPSSESFGTLAFACLTLADAKKKISILKKTKEPEDGEV